MAEDEVPDRCINFTRSISLAQDASIIKHRRKQQPWDVTLYGGPQSSGFRARLIDAVGRERLLFVTSSQREGKRLERAIAKTPAGKKVVRIDSETNEGNNLVIQVGDRRISIFDDPDTWISEVQPDVLILSPSAKSGLSITATETLMDQIPPYFKSVWGYFPALGGDTHWQMLARYRLPVPRHIYVPPFIQSNSDEALMSARRARQRYQSDAKGLSAALELSEMLEADSEEQERYTRIQTAVLDYRAEQAEVQGAMKAIAYDYLLRRLERAGHHVIEEKAGVSKVTSELWKQVQDEIWAEDAEEFAAINLEDIHTEEWAQRTLNSNDSTRVNRVRAHKVLYRLEFPGVIFDDASECYEALMLDYGAMRRGVRLQSKCQNLEAARSLDREKASKLLEKDIKALHRMPQDFVKAFLLSKVGILDLLDGSEYHNQDPRAISVKERALELSNEIYYRLRLNIKSTQTPVEICNKLLRKFGLEINKPDRPGAIQASQPGSRDDRGDRHYRVDLDYSPVRKRLLEASQRKLSESVHTICIDQNPNIQIVCTDSQDTQEPLLDKVLGPGLAVGSVVRWGTSIGDWHITALDGAIATIHQVRGWASATPFTANIQELTAV
ncbi:MAG: hypothetical protein F6K36_29870 [Symploca sp. SIO3C6]|nr:hypothetical protein [Symploca sp. SIO3C6]